MSIDNFKREFREFGNNINLLAIFMLLSIPFPFLIIGILILMTKMLNNIKNANSFQFNKYLLEFHSKYKNSAILRVIGLLFTVGSATLFAFALQGIIFLNPWYILIILICSIAILFAGSLSELKAWEELKYFFEEQNELFPQQTLKDAVEGCNKLKTGASIYLLWFLVIPILIGYIFQLVGFFKLSILKNMGITR